MRVSFDKTSREAASFFKVHLEDVTEDMRRAWKMITFMQRYGKEFKIPDDPLPPT